MPQLNDLQAHVVLCPRCLVSLYIGYFGTRYQHTMKCKPSGRETERYIERKTLPCCQDADPVITISVQGPSVITVPSVPYYGVVWLTFVLANCIEMVYGS